LRELGRVETIGTADGMIVTELSSPAQDLVNQLLTIDCVLER
jgi:hypothetical protein